MMVLSVSLAASALSLKCNMNKEELEDKIGSIHFVSPIVSADQGIFTRAFLTEFEKERYPNSWAYITQACRGLGKFGYKYHHEDEIMGIGAHRGHYALINPIGKEIGVAVQKLCRLLWEMTKKPVFIKHFQEGYQQELKTVKGKFVSMDEYPWEEGVPYDDATFPEVITDFQEFYRKLYSSENSKFRLRLNRFLNTLRSEGVDQIAVKPYIPEWEYDEVMELLRTWAGDDTQRIEPYQNMVDIPSASGFSYITKISGKVISFHTFDRIGLHTAAAYANIVDRKSYPGSSEACLISAMSELQKYGITTINFGGSEVESLHWFKRKYVPYTERDIRKEHVVYIGDK